MANVVQVKDPLTLVGMDVDAGLLREAWASEIYLESLLVEPLINNPLLTESVGPGNDGQKVPEKIFMNVATGVADTKGVRDIVLSFLKSLSGTGLFGRNTSDQAGAEEQLVLKYCKFFSNDWSHAVAAETFGIDFRELSPYQIYEKAKPLLAQWLGELDGLFARQGMYETRSQNLTDAPVSLTQPLNPNIWIPSATAPVPVYNGDPDNYEDNVVTGLGSGNVTAANCHFTIAYLLELSDHAADIYIKPMAIGGYDIYLLLMHPDEYRRMIDPATTASWAAFYKDVAATSDIAAAVPGAMGMVGDSIVVTRDRRAGTLSVAASATTVSLAYMKMGRNDTRATTRTANVNYNCNMLLGTNALSKLVTEEPHYEEQKDRYGKFKGIGYFGAFAWQICSWDDDAKGTSADDATQQEGSILIPTQR